MRRKSVESGSRKFEVISLYFCIRCTLNHRRCIESCRKCIKCYRECLSTDVFIECDCEHRNVECKRKCIESKIHCVIEHTDGYLLENTSYALSEYRVNKYPFTLTLGYVPMLHKKELKMSSYAFLSCTFPGLVLKIIITIKYTLFLVGDADIAAYIMHVSSMLYI